MEKPNVVLIVVDEMRGDCIGGAGHPDVKTPYLDTLITNGVYFPNAYSSCPSCIPARAALLTGLTQRSHGRVGYADGVRWAYTHTIATEMSRIGYYTQAIGKMHVHPLRNYLGFHHVELHDGYLHNYRGNNVPYGESQLIADDYFYWLKKEKGIDCDITDTGLDCNSWVARPWIYEEKCHPTNWVTDRSIDFLRRRDPDQPFFLYASYVRPHAPYDAPQVYFDMYKNKNLRSPFKGDWDDGELLKTQGRVFNSSTGPVDPELIREQQIGYYACITHLDHQIGRIMLSLIEQGLDKNTVIIFTSDHGELLSDHALSRKIRPYQGSVHIPMIVSGPPSLIGNPRISNALVELRDVLPTAVSLKGERPDPSVEGISMLEEKISKREYIHGEHSAGVYSNHFIVTKTDKYIWYSQTGEEQYFNLAKDPNESHNAVSDNDSEYRVAYLRQQLINELNGREEGYSDGVKLITGCTPKTCLSHVI